MIQTIILQKFIFMYVNKSSPAAALHFDARVDIMNAESWWNHAYFLFKY